VFLSGWWAVVDDRGVSKKWVNIKDRGLCGMESERQFAALITGAYTVLWDVNEKMVEIREKVLLSRKQRAKGSGVAFTDHAWKKWPTPSDKNAHALELSTDNLVETINSMSDAEKKPTVDEKDIPAMFMDMRITISAMQSQVPAVEAEYAVDCSALKISMQTAVTQLQAYLTWEGASAEKIRQSEKIRQISPECTRSSRTTWARTWPSARRGRA
jgi:hypothetical protein